MQVGTARAPRPPAAAAAAAHSVSLRMRAESPSEPGASERPAGGPGAPAPANQTAVSPVVAARNPTHHRSHNADTFFSNCRPLNRAYGAALAGRRPLGPRPRRGQKFGLSMFRWKAVQFLLFCNLGVCCAFVLSNVNLRVKTAAPYAIRSYNSLYGLSSFGHFHAYSNKNGAISKLSMELDLLQSLECVKNVRDMASVKGSPIKPGRNVKHILYQRFQLKLLTM